MGAKRRGGESLFMLLYVLLFVVVLQLQRNRQDSCCYLYCLQFHFCNIIYPRIYIFYIYVHQLKLNHLNRFTGCQRLPKASSRCAHLVSIKSICAKLP